MATTSEEVYFIEELLRMMGGGKFLNTLFKFWTLFETKADNHHPCPRQLSNWLAEASLSERTDAAFLVEKIRQKNDAKVKIYLVTSAYSVALAELLEEKSDEPHIPLEIKLSVLTSQDLDDLIEEFPSLPSDIRAAMICLFEGERAMHKNDLAMLDAIEREIKKPIATAS